MGVGLFSIFSGFYHWIFQLVNARYSKILVKIHFWVLSVVISVIFFSYIFMEYPSVWFSEIILTNYCMNRLVLWGNSIFYFSYLIFIVVIFEAFVCKNFLPFLKWCANNYITFICSAGTGRKIPNVFFDDLFLIALLIARFFFYDSNAFIRILSLGIFPVLFIILVTIILYIPYLFPNSFFGKKLTSFLKNFADPILFSYYFKKL